MFRRTGVHSLTRTQPEETTEMPKVSKDSAANVEHHGPVDDRHQDLEGYTVNFVTFEEDIDATPLLKGMPDDKCPCPHWGYVLKGRVTYRFADHDEVFNAGDAFYLSPGHIPVVDAGCELVQFSPAEQLQRVTELMKANMRAALGAQA
jgi:hypothetical protein